MNPPAGATRGLVVLGEFFVDLVFYDLPTAPKMGEEVKTRRFAEFPGGGVATTALVAAGLGCPTTVITRVGRDIQGRPAWQKFEQHGIYVGACDYTTRFPTAKTVCAAFDGERMMITHDAINQGLHALLNRPAVRRQIRKARHLHLACPLQPLKTWIRAIREFRSQGLTISTDIGWNPEVLQAPQLPTILRECDFTFPSTPSWSRDMSDTRISGTWSRLTAMSTSFILRLKACWACQRCGTPSDIESIASAFITPIGRRT